LYLIVDKINQINLIACVCVLLSQIKCYMSSFGTNACIPTFATLIITFMTSVNRSSIRRMSGMA